MVKPIMNTYEVTYHQRKKPNSPKKTKLVKAKYAEDAANIVTGYNSTVDKVKLVVKRRTWRMRR